jgi:hypothetical protein
MKETKSTPSSSRKWKRVTQRIAAGQTFILISLMYFLIIPFFSLIRLSDPLKIKPDKKSKSYWEPKKTVDTSINGMKKLS